VERRWLYGAKRNADARHLQRRWKCIYHLCTEHLRPVSNPGKNKILEPLAPLPPLGCPGIQCNCKVRNKWDLRSGFSFIVKRTFNFIYLWLIFTTVGRITVRKEPSTLLIPCEILVFVLAGIFGCHNSEPCISIPFLKLEQESSRLNVFLQCCKRLLGPRPMCCPEGQTPCPELWCPSPRTVTRPSAPCPKSGLKIQLLCLLAPNHPSQVREGLSFVLFFLIPFDLDKL